MKALTFSLETKILLSAVLAEVSYLRDPSECLIELFGMVWKSQIIDLEIHECNQPIKLFGDDTRFWAG